MLKKQFLFFLLAFAYSIVLVHNIVPHHHHDEHRNAFCHDGQECAGKSDDSGSQNLFSFFGHNESHHPVFIGHAAGSNTFTKETAANLFISALNFVFYAPDAISTERYVPANFSFKQKSILLIRALRAPPFQL